MKNKSYLLIKAFNSLLEPEVFQLVLDIIGMFL